MLGFLIKTPSIIIKLLDNFTWCFSSSKKELYLTFDDGPTPEVTNFVLNELKKHDAKATFFCIGKNVVNHPEIYTKILSEGHSVGNHTHNHFNGWKNSTKAYLENTSKANQVINSNLFRPPYGKIRPSQIKKLKQNGYKIVLWTILSEDYNKKISPTKCLNNVLNNVENGNIIVLHDSVKCYDKIKFVLPKILTELSNEGYTFKGIPYQNVI